MSITDRDLDSLNRDIEEEILKLSDSVESDMALFRRGGSRRAALTRASKPLAIALELLELGAAKHFGQGKPASAYGTPAANINLVTADVYYARALELVVSLGDDRLVHTLCEALAEVSEGYAYPDLAGAEERRDAFAAAARATAGLIEEIDNAVVLNPS